jgi:isoprenylcysteine carboxyl methyltransferase (ICMT) family protein YpbQ
MNRNQLCFVAAAFAARLASLAWSKRNERKLRAAGAREFGHLNSRALALAHLAFYAAAPVEATLRGRGPSPRVGWLGVALYTVAMGMLVWVCRALGPLWTVKVLIGPQQRVVRSGPYRLCKHPNYFLNLLPELVGYGLALGAWRTLRCGLPCYTLCLAVRIRQEEAAMGMGWVGYGDGIQPTNGRGQTRNRCGR